MNDIQILEEYFNLFNKFLFDNKLPTCVITIQRHKKARGYFWASMFENRTDKKHTSHEIALNPINFDRSMKEILSTLVHEMCHLWQQEFGLRKSLKAYHNKEWADKMELLGLMPSSTGMSEGKKTGQSMSHYIIAGGVYDCLFYNKIFKDMDIKWKSRIQISFTTGNEKVKTSKNKFTCPECGMNVWAKETAKIICGDCKIDMRLDL